MAPDGLKADNFLAVLPPLGNLTGLGAIDSKNNLDFKMVANLANAVASATGAAGGTTSGAAGGIGRLLSQITGARGGCKGGPTTVAFLAQRTAFHPQFISPRCALCDVDRK